MSSGFGNCEGVPPNYRTHSTPAASRRFSNRLDMGSGSTSVVRYQAGFRGRNLIRDFMVPFPVPHFSPSGVTPNLFLHFPVLHFPPSDFTLNLFLHFPVLHFPPCGFTPNFVLHFPVLQFPPSGLQGLLVLHFTVPHFQRTRLN